MPTKNVRIGIDVGGTFTHAVALTCTPNQESAYQIIATSKVPTTHTAELGVAQGIIDALKEILSSANLHSDDISYIAHATTQATNALLEGDVCPVGILALGSGLEGKIVQSETKIDNIALAPEIILKIYHRYLEINANGTVADQEIESALQNLYQQGARSFVAATAFSVDHPELENNIVQHAIALGYPATATHEISQLYGLKARTRTAAINAAILPKMMDSADKTKEALQKMKIHAPLLIMRSDGGAMGVEEMKKRPILTLLSGPAAGVAAALMAARISDGIFLEVGGTSTDISCITNGHPTLKMAQIGEHKLYLNTLDVRTLGVAGGSLVKIKNNKIVSVGPRSAHIQGFQYASFTPKIKNIQTMNLEKFPLPNDHFYLISQPEKNEPPITITPTCAIELLENMSDKETPKNQETIHQFFSKMTQFLGVQSPQELAHLIMKTGATAMIKTIKNLITEYQLEKEQVTLIGGGGGAGVWLNYLGKTMGYPSTIVQHAPVISAIGAALALLQESIERTIIDPKAEDFIDIRKKAVNALLKTGASPESIEVRVEVDSQHGILRAIATGCEQLRLGENNLSLEELQARAQKILMTNTEMTCVAQHANFVIFQACITQKKWWGFLSQTRLPWVAIDRKGRIRLNARHGKIKTGPSETLLESMEAVIQEHSNYNDAGLVLPHLFIITDTKIIDLTGLTQTDQILAICEAEKESIVAKSQVSIAIKK